MLNTSVKGYENAKTLTNRIILRATNLNIMK